MNQIELTTMKRLGERLIVAAANDSIASHPTTNQQTTRIAFITRTYSLEETWILVLRNFGIPWSSP